MRRRIVAALAFATMSVVMVGAPAFAHDLGPCNESGLPGNSDFAQHHVVFHAQEGTLGTGGHVPGAHQGFSFCNPSGP